LDNIIAYNSAAAGISLSAAAELYAITLLAFV
jgi:hypothetical protein